MVDSVRDITITRVGQFKKRIKFNTKTAKIWSTRYLALQVHYEIYLDNEDVEGFIKILKEAGLNGDW